MSCTDAPMSLITLDHITVRLRDRLVLRDTCWNIRPGRHWAVIGPNGSGKSTLVKAVAGQVPVMKGRVIRYNAAASIHNIGYVSFERQLQLMAAEDRMDHSRYFTGDIHQVTPVRRLFESEYITALPPSPDLQWAIGLMDIGHLLDRGIRTLSTGEMRKALIARELAKKPSILILDEPFEGLDIESRNHLSQVLSNLTNERMQLILVTHRMEHLIPEISHVIRLENCRVAEYGSRKAMLAPCGCAPAAVRRCTPNAPKAEASGVTGHIADSAEPDEVICMKQVRIDYGPVRVLNAIDWTVKEGENWALTGPNGAGKTSLLRLISGDHPQAYANDIRLFGIQRGSGESIWDIKKRMGLMSSGMHVRHRKRLRAMDVIRSGFFDSVGLYRRCTPEQDATARQWVERLHIGQPADQWFDQLSFGQQRMILIARALVKSPSLLVLDEPCQGLDAFNRNAVHHLIDEIGRSPGTQILYVTHHREELPPCIRHELRLVKSSAGGFTCVRYE